MDHSTFIANPNPDFHHGLLGVVYAAAISNSGNIVGEFVVNQQNGTYTFHAFLYTDGVMHDLGPVPSGPDGSTSAADVNDSKQVVGYGYYYPPGITLGFLYTNGTMQELSGLGGEYTRAYGINKNGQVVGEALLPDGTGFHPILYDADGAIHDLRLPPTSIFGARAVDINDSGQIVVAAPWGTSDWLGFLYSDGAYQGSWDGIGMLPGADRTGPEAINNGGQIVGRAHFPLPDDHFVAFLYTNGVIQALPLPSEPGLEGFATDINNSGHIVGYANGLPGNAAPSRALLWRNGTVTDLNTLIPANSGWYLSSAQSINDSGQIVGGGTDPSGEQHSYLLTPSVPYKALVKPPINADGSSIFKANRGVIPVKFSLTEDEIATCALPPATISVTRTAGGVIGFVDEGTYSMAADVGSNFRIDPTACQYIYNLAASSMGVGTYRVDILIDGNVVGNAVFALK